MPADKPKLLIYDGHASHVSVELIEEAMRHNVTLIKLPPHTTHVLQPLDVAVFKGLKDKWDKQLCAWQRSNPRKKIPKSNFVQILTAVYNDLPVSSVKNGFITTGIYDPEKGGPNRLKIKTAIFRPDDLKNYEARKREDSSPTACNSPVPE